MSRDGNLEYRDALHGYARALLRLLQHVFGITQADVARQCGVSRPLVTFWQQGQQRVPPHHEHVIRRLLMEAVAGTRRDLDALDAEALSRFRKQLLDALMDLDGAVTAMTVAYARSVRAMNRETMGSLEDILTQACTGEVAGELHQAYTSVQETRAKLRRLWPGAKARNRALKALLVNIPTDVRTHVAQLLDYVMQTYGVQETTTTDSPAPTRGRKGRRPRAMIEKGDMLV